MEQYLEMLLKVTKQRKQGLITDYEMVAEIFEQSLKTLGELKG